MVKKTAQFIFSIYGFLIFLIWMFLLLPFFIVAFCLPSPRNGNLVFVIARFWAHAFLAMTGIRYNPVQKGLLNKNEGYVFVCNHISYMDIPMMLLSTSGFNIRILGKAEMRRIPIFGFIYKMGTVSVIRSDKENRSESIREMKDFLSQNISIMICPEGTFNMSDAPLKEFYDGAFRIAIECGKSIVPIIFPDTFDRLSYKSIFSMTPGKCRAILLPEMPVSNYSIEQLSELKNEVWQTMKSEIIHLQPSWISGLN